MASPLVSEPGMFSEKAPPWDATLGINEWLPVNAQWAFTIASIVSFFLWGATGPSLPLLDQWIYLIFFIFGLPAFYGLVSEAHETVLGAHVFLYGMAVVWWYFGALLPYICGGFVLPLASAHVYSGLKKGLVQYDMEAASFAGPMIYGSMNAGGYLLYKHLCISDHFRWFLVIFTLSMMTGGTMIIKTLLGQPISSYKLNLMQLIRYYGFCCALYTFQFYFAARLAEKTIMGPDSNFFLTKCQV